MKIIIAGDLVPGYVYEDSFKKDINSLFDEDILTVWNSADLRIVNLESPLVNTGIKSSKNGIALKSPIEAINGIGILNIGVACMANNHSMDYGYEGAKSTVKFLDSKNIPHVGIGNNAQEAREPHIITINDIRIGIYNCADTEFGLAGESVYGINPHDSYDVSQDIRNLKKKVDFLVVIFHSGKEHYQYPTPRLQKYCRRMIDSGADMVITQHSHCIGARELYKEKEIVYGQGNFLFQMNDTLNNELWSKGLLIELIIEQGKKTSVRYVPFLSDANGIRLPSDQEAKTILDDFFMRSEMIENAHFVSDNYSILADQSIDNYLSNMDIIGKFLLRLERKIFRRKKSSFLCRKSRLLKILNYFESDVHNEIIIEGIKKRIYEK